MIELQIGDSRKLIHGLTDKSIDCVMTSPPYWGLRDYGTEPIIFDGAVECNHIWGEDIVKKQSGGTNGGISLTQDTSIHIHNTSNFCSLCGAWLGQLGLEPTPELYLSHLLDFFDDVKLKLKDKGNCFVNLGDSYYGSPSNSKDSNLGNAAALGQVGRSIRQKHEVLQSKSLCMIPERFAWGMIERGWILRNSIIWYKRNHMPESVTDRWTKAHEVIYFFTKQQKNYFNLDAIRQPHKTTCKRTTRKMTSIIKFGATSTFNGGSDYNPLGANPGTVWDVTTQPYSEAHFATFPLELVKQPILAGCPVGGTVLDPFGGSGTVGEFCRNNERNAILFELNPKYKKLINERAMITTPELSSWCSTKTDA